MLAVPPGVVTAMLFAPALPAGVTAVMLVDETTFTLVAATPPTVTLVAPVKSVPVMVIAVPPRVVPDDGLTPEIVGAGNTNINALGKLAVPPAVVTATLFAPAVPAGVSAVMLVDETTFTLVAAIPPTVTLLASVKFVPVIVIAVPPRVVPEVGLTPEIVGVGTTNVNALGKLVVPPAVVTATSFAPALPAGVTAVMLVDETTITLVAATPPIVTMLAPVKFVPVMVIAVPPRFVPDDGLTLEIVGTETT
jgi:hypothetical protein